EPGEVDTQHQEQVSLEGRAQMAFAAPEAGHRREAVGEEEDDPEEDDPFVDRAHQPPPGVGGAGRCRGHQGSRRAGTKLSPGSGGVETRGRGWEASLARRVGAPAWPAAVLLVLPALRSTSRCSWVSDW